MDCIVRGIVLCYFEMDEEKQTILDIWTYGEESKWRKE